MPGDDQCPARLERRPRRTGRNDITRRSAECRDVCAQSQNATADSGSVGQCVMRVMRVSGSVGHAGHGSNFSTHLDGSVGSSATIAMIH